MFSGLCLRDYVCRLAWGRLQSHHMSWRRWVSNIENGSGGGGEGEVGGGRRRNAQPSVLTWWRSRSIGMAVSLSERRTWPSSSKLIWEKYFGSVIGTPVDSNKAFRPLSYVKLETKEAFTCLVNESQGKTISGKDMLTRCEGLVHSHTVFQSRHRYVITKLYVRIRRQRGTLVIVLDYISLWLATCVKWGETAGVGKIISVKVCNNSADVIVQEPVSVTGLRSRFYSSDLKLSALEFKRKRRPHTESHIS